MHIFMHIYSSRLYQVRILTVHRGTVRSALALAHGTVFNLGSFFLKVVGSCMWITALWFSQLFRDWEYLYYTGLCGVESSDLPCALIVPFKVWGLSVSALSQCLYYWVWTLGQAMSTQALRTASELDEILGVVWVPTCRHNSLAPQRNVEVAETG